MLKAYALKSAHFLLLFAYLSIAFLAWVNLPQAISNYHTYVNTSASSGAFLHLSDLIHISTLYLALYAALLSSIALISSYKTAILLSVPGFFLLIAPVVLQSGSISTLSGETGALFMLFFIIPTHLFAVAGLAVTWVGAWLGKKHVLIKLLLTVGFITVPVIWLNNFVILPVPCSSISNAIKRDHCQVQTVADSNPADACKICAGLSTVVERFNCGEKILANPAFVPTIDSCKNIAPFDNKEKCVARLRAAGILPYPEPYRVR
jgi:hypothetical protein